MRRRGLRQRVLLSTVAAAALACSTQVAPAAADFKLATPPDGSVYHAAYPEFRGSEDHVRTRYVSRFERLAGKDVAWAYFSNNWTKGINFPATAVARINAAGTVPFIRLMARSDFDEGGPDERYTMARILSGEFDAELTAWGQAAAAQPTPLLVEFGTEVNGFWFPWNGRWNGAGETAGYGDPLQPDGPERFRDAFRRVHDLIEGAGAHNVTWFWHVDDDGWPKTPWNTIASYYPGDAYVDWIGVSVYGPLTLDEHWGPGFQAKLDQAYPQLTALSPDRPIAVLEYGARQGARKGRWIRNAIASVAEGRWPRVKALSVWHERWRNEDGTVSNLHIDSDRKALRAYRRSIRRGPFTDQALFAP